MDVLAARKLEEDARRKLRAGDANGALALLDKAMALEPRAEVLRDKGDALRVAGRDADALDAYATLLSTYGARLGARRGEVEKLIAELQKKLGVLEVQCATEGAEVTLDDAPVGRTPLAAPLRRAAGAHRLRVVKEGFDPFEASLELRGGEETSVTVELVATRKVARVRVAEAKSADVRVLIDGDDVGSAPWEGDLEEGAHTFALRGPAHQAPARTVAVTRGHAVALELRATPRKGHVRLEASVPTATLLIDGVEVGQGTFATDLPYGAHTWEARAAGRSTQQGSFEIGEKDALVSATLVAPSAAPTEAPDAASARGFSFELSAFGAYSLTPLTYACSGDATCTSSASTPLGGGLVVRPRWSFGVVSLELSVATLAYLQQDRNEFDGSAPSTSPDHVDASIARTEQERLFSGGVFAGPGIRATSRGAHVRVTAGASLGLSYRAYFFQRDVSNATSSDTWVPKPVLAAAPGALADVALLVGSRPGTQLKLGVMLWADLPSSEVLTEDGGARTLDNPRGGTALLDSSPFMVGRRPELFVGPLLGVQFGR